MQHTGEHMYINFANNDANAFNKTAYNHFRKILYQHLTEFNNYYDLKKEDRMWAVNSATGVKLFAKWINEKNIFHITPVIIFDKHNNNKHVFIGVKVTEDERFTLEIMKV